MTTKEHVIELIEALPDSPEGQLQLEDIEHKLEPTGTGDGDDPVDDGDAETQTSEISEPAKVGFLPFFAIGASDASDVSERFDEYLGRAIEARHPRS
jgi:hypothetical protein